MGRPARLLNVPIPLLRGAASVLGKRAAVDRLTGSLWVDSGLIRARLGWVPPYSLQAGLAETVAALK
jgi:UDP-glucose 4-epimerase